MNTNYKYKKFIATTTLIAMLFVQNPLSISVLAQTGITDPAIVVESTPTPPSIPSTPDVTATPPASPTPVVMPTVNNQQSTETVTPTPTETVDPEREEWRRQRDERRAKQKEEEALKAQSNSDTISNGGNVGDTIIKTGDATNSANIATDANANISTGAVLGTSGATVINSGNGSGSSNNGSVSSDNTSNVNQGNGAVVANTLNQASVTGKNDSSKNVGNTTIQTGDANTSGTVITSVNTNVDGVMVAEFNIADNHIGDIVLDFAANCVQGCGGNTTVANTGNGVDSENDASVDERTETNIFQENDATIENDLTLLANSGDNSSNKNTGGNTSITTGDANVNANVLNFANNNIVGNVIYAVVNIFGDLVGDILMPDVSSSPCCGSNSNSANSGNGADSTNTASSTAIDTENINQFNAADIENNLILDVNSGENEVSKNTNGNSSIETGESTLIAQTVNIANMNLAQGNYWLVLVYEAGKWIGKIAGSGEETNLAGSPNMEFAVDPNGEVSVSNTANANGASNTGSVSSESNTNITQTNDAKIVNNVNLTANTGNNSASKNTGGNSSITTGDATVVANIVNFVNNNIVGNGKLFVTVVNVFGNWIGDFVGPGQSPEETPTVTQNDPGNSEVARGGTSLQSNTNNSNNQNNNPQTLGTSIAQTITKKLTQRVLGINTNDDGETSVEVVEDISNETEQLPQVASSKTEKKKIKINLAWSLLGIPLFGAFVIAKKKRKTEFKNV